MLHHTELEKAVKRNDVDGVLAQIRHINTSNAIAQIKQIPAAIFSEMMSALGLAKNASGACGFQVFSWIIDHHSKLSPQMQHDVDQFVSDNYANYREPAVLIAFAEWVGGMGNLWALGVIEKWIASSPNEVAFRHIGTAIREFENFNSDDNPEVVNRFNDVSSKYLEAKSNVR